MKKSLIISLIAVVAMGCATNPAQDRLPEGLDSDLASFQEVVLTVHGLSCPLCANNIDSQLLRLEGVEEARVNLNTGAVSVRFQEGHAVSPGDLAAAVENAGFTLKEIVPKVKEE